MKSLLNRKSDSFFQLVLLTVLLGLLAYYFICLFSFHSLDESTIAASYPKVPLVNRGGVIGAYLSAWVFYHFGWLAYLLPVSVLICFWPIHFSFAKLLRNVIGLICLGFFCVIFLADIKVPMNDPHIEFLGEGVWGASFYKWCSYWFGINGARVLGLTFFVMGLICVLSYSFCWRAVLFMLQSIFSVLRLMREKTSFLVQKKPVEIESPSVSFEDKKKKIF